MAGEFRELTQEEEEICLENKIDTEGKVVVLSNDNCLVLLHHDTRDNIYIRFGEKRAQKNAVP